MHVGLIPVMITVLSVLLIEGSAAVFATMVFMSNLPPYTSFGLRNAVAMSDEG